MISKAKKYVIMFVIISLFLQGCATGGTRAGYYNGYKIVKQVEVIDDPTAPPVKD